MVAFFTYSLAELMRTNLLNYTELGDLATAEKFIAPMWLFTLSYAVMLVVLALMVFFDLRRRLAYGVEICSSECDKKCRNNNHYEWND
jgi:hypothetical protein